MGRGELAGAAALLLLAAGCGSSSSSGSVCGRVVQGYHDYGTKAAACGVNIPIGSFDQASCESALNASGCTAADRELWGNFGSCLSGLPSCTTGNTTPFTTAVVACTTTLSDGLSPACE